MSILNTREIIHIRNELSIKEINEFGTILEKIEKNFINKEFDKDIDVAELHFPTRGRPRSMCRWYISSKRNMLYYFDELDDFIYKEPDTYGQMVSWLRYLIKHYFTPKGIILNGMLEFESISGMYMGKVFITCNEVNKKIYEQMFGFGPF